MLIYITITINKTHNIYDSIYAASTYDSVNIAVAIKQFANELLMLLRKYEYFMDKNTLWFDNEVFDMFKVKLYVKTKRLRVKWFIQSQNQN